MIEFSTSPAETISIESALANDHIRQVYECDQAPFDLIPAWDPFDRELPPRLHPLQVIFPDFDHLASPGSLFSSTRADRILNEVPQGFTGSGTEMWIPSDTISNGNARNIPQDQNDETLDFSVVDTALSQIVP